MRHVFRLDQIGRDDKNGESLSGTRFADDRDSYVRTGMIKRIVFSLFLFVLSAGQFSAYGQAGDLRDTAQDQSREISQYAARLASENPDLPALRQHLNTKRTELTRLTGELQVLRDQTRERLGLLGDALAGEAQSVSDQRVEIEAQLEDLNTALEQTQANLDEITRLEGEIADLRREAFYDELTDRKGMLIDPRVWIAAGAEVRDNADAVVADVSEWAQSDDGGRYTLTTVLMLLLAAVLAFCLALPFRHWLDIRFVRPLGRLEQNQSFGAPIGLMRALLRSLPSLLAIGVLDQAVHGLGLVSPGMESPLRALWVALSCIIVIEAVLTIFMSTRTPIPPGLVEGISSSGRLWGLCLSTVTAVGIDHVLREETLVFGQSAELDVVQRGVVALVLAGLLYAISRVWKPGKDDGGLLPKWVRTLIRVIVLLSGLAAVFGYSSFAHFLTTRTVLIGGLFLCFLIARVALRQIFRELIIHLSGGRTEPRESNELFGFWIGFFVDLILIMFLVPLALLLVGLEWTTVSQLLTRAVTGVSIGSFRISLVQIGVAILTVFALIMFTRFVQRTTDRRVLAHLRMDGGVRNSLKTLIGYVGLVIAFMTGVGMLGFNLSNLAIIAGALSVGIGFGLQSIVNNFVSGLILLFERPIKVGDWVVTNSGEGIVKKISVRSTEVETFDRSSILIPNSELISSSVTNWTHKNKIGRVIVPVGVAYKEDPDQIMGILREVSTRVEGVLKDPPPQIFFMAFGDSSIDFELRLFIPDVTQGPVVRTRARIEIFKAFREAGVEIPFPQRDIHIRSEDKPQSENG